MHYMEELRATLHSIMPTMTDHATLSMTRGRITHCLWMVRNQEATDARRKMSCAPSPVSVVISRPSCLACSTAPIVSGPNATSAGSAACSRAAQTVAG